MKDLSMHLMDIAQNSVRAKASQVILSVWDVDDSIILQVEDDGTGMDEATIKKVSDPFFTSRTKRKVGLGIPLFKQNAELTGGSILLQSTLGKGTLIKAVFIKTNIDCLPRGDLAQTVTLLMVGHPTVDFVFNYQNKCHYKISSHEIKEAIGEENFHNPRAIRLIRELIEENLAESGFESDF